VNDGGFERLGHIVGVDVMHELRAEPGNIDGLSGRESVPHRGVEVADWADRVPAGADDVTGVQ
jgi:hypothetical protein